MSITNMEVIKAFFHDFSFLYEKRCRPKIELSFDGERCKFARIKKSTSNGYCLEFNHYYAHSEVSEYKDFIICLMICGHELAHWAHRHLDHNDSDDMDSRAIESWADFYGSKVFMTTLCFGQQLANINNRLRTDMQKSRNLLDAIGDAIYWMHLNIYKLSDDSEKYPPSDLRVIIVGAGILSFFFRLLGRLDKDLSLQILRKILLHPFAGSPVLQAQYDMDEEATVMERNHEILLSSMNGKRVITEGLKARFGHILGTSYVGAEQNEIHRQRLKKEIQNWGFDV